jgi:cytoskeletal protein CcmA (bactofilin family)
MIFKKDEAEEADPAVPTTSTPHERRQERREERREERGEGRPDGREERQMSDNGEVTVVGVGARLEGNVVSAGSLRIDGQVKGQINADGDVTLSPQSQVEADIRAQNVSVGGRFKGNIAVKGKAHLARGGRVDGNITSKTLVVEEGGIFHGQSIMDGASGAQPAAGQTGGQQVAPPADRPATDKTEQVKVL